jgi:ABC-type glycerol-3-phosphate transport system substrate-binding protein
MPVNMQGRPGTTAAFLAGQASIVDFNNAAITTALHPRNVSADVRYWMIPYPQGPGSRSSGTHTWANFIGLSRVARNRDQGWEFLRWFAGDLELHYLRLQMMNSPSSLRAFYLDPRWPEAVKAIPQLDIIPEMAELPGQAPYRRAADQKREIVPILTEAFLGQRDIRNALLQAQAIADRVLSQ